MPNVNQAEAGPIVLDDLIAEAEKRAEHVAAQAAERAREQEHQSLRVDRQAAVKHVRDVLEIPTLPNAWERLEAQEGYIARAVVHPFDDEDELRLAFRQRSHTQGGPVLTVLALARDGETWIGSGSEITGLEDLPAVIEDARDRAVEWPIDEDEREELLEGETNHVPEIVVSGDTLAEILEAVVGMVAVRHATPYDA